MKKTVILFLTFVTIIACLLAVSALATEIDGVFYTLDKDGTATVNTKNQTSTTEDVTIPSEVTHNGVTYKVDSIEEKAFQNNDTVKVIRILSKHITVIPSRFILGTYDGALEKVFIDFPSITSIGTYGLNTSSERNDRTPSTCKESFYFYDAKAYLNDKSEVRIDKPVFNGNVAFGDACFQACAKFTEVIIPSGATMAQQCFRRTTATYLEIQGEDRTSLPYYGFAECSRLQTIKVLSKNISEVKGSAFGGCSAVTSIYIDLSKCVTINDSSFQIGSTGYDSGNTKTQWYNLDGEKKVDLTNVQYLNGSNKSSAFSSSNIGSAEITWPKALKAIGNQMFRKCNITGTIYLNGTESNPISIEYYALDGNYPSIVILGDNVSYYNCELTTAYTLVMLNPSIKITRSSLFKASGSQLYYAGFSADSTYTSFDRCTTTQIISGTADHYGPCGVVASLVTADGNVTVGETTHNYNLVDYDNTYCPMNTMGNYLCDKCLDDKKEPNEGTNPIKDGHTYNQIKSIVYAQGFLSDGVKSTACACAYEKTEVVEPIFTFSGYSTKKNDSAICIGYGVSTIRLNEYNSVNEDAKLGFVVSLNTENPLTVENGEIKCAENTVVAPVIGAYSSYEFILSGFGQNMLDIALAMCAYVYDGEKISYLATEATSTPTAITLNEIIAMEK